jgi:hypothetical protein
LYTPNIMHPEYSGLHDLDGRRYLILFLMRLP